MFYNQSTNNYLQKVSRASLPSLCQPSRPPPTLLDCITILCSILALAPSSAGFQAGPLKWRSLPLLVLDRAHEALHKLVPILFTPLMLQHLTGLPAALGSLLLLEHFRPQDFCTCCSLSLESSSCSQALPPVTQAYLKVTFSNKPLSVLPALNTLASFPVHHLVSLPTSQT